MADVNANLPMWHKAYWSQAERDNRREMAEDKESRRRLYEAVVLQKLVNEGRLTEQQAQNAAAMARQESEQTFKSRENELDRDFQWNERMLTGGQKEVITKRAADLDRWVAERNAAQQEETVGLRRREDETARANAALRAVYGNVGGAEVTDPVVSHLLGSMGIKYDNPIETNKLGHSAAAGTKRPVANLRISAGVTPRSDSAAPPVPAPTGPTPGPDAKLAPTSADMKLYEDWQNLQRRLNPVPK